MPTNDETAEITSLTQSLVRIRSQNPMDTEDECASFVATWLSGFGMTPQIREVYPGRHNVGVRLAGTHDEPPLVLLAHMDTVPAGVGWSKDPFGGEIAEGRLYGRGASDMKAGLAAAMVVTKRLSETREAPRGDVWFVATVDEESGAMGGSVNLARSGLIPKNARIIATEPTSSSTVDTVHRGAVWYSIRSKGRMAHAAHSHLGVDAIHAMALIIARLKHMCAELPFEHPRLGKSVLNIGSIEGGGKTNVVPARCEIAVDFRIVPPLTCDEADALVEEAVHDALREFGQDAKADVEHIGLPRPPVQTADDAGVVKALKKAHLEGTGRPLELGGKRGYTDAAIMGHLNGNLECVAFGPGDTVLAHTVDEYVTVTQLPEATNTLERAARGLLY